MQELNFPKYEFRIKKELSRTYIFDEIRRSYVILTPEEWVRQNLLKYLVHEKAYAKGLLKIEHTLHINNLTKRCDILVYNKTAKPVMIVECKAATVKISQDTFEQIAVYNLNLKVNYLLITNGLTHFCCYYDFQTLKPLFLDNIPAFTSINN